ncbi:dynamin family protein [Hoyosella sp. YIM 151337]|uniref:dynamin family protein n=1 Tax=Hoyosella sp. YIM 151337 TaxID=2992742 RepID=UPI002236181D|nr:dynamin family protein [Hoyosella sp. YIM 151337]MCW4352563.1 dynamin family protein [Hoyosella sp. YIM 151337]
MVDTALRAVTKSGRDDLARKLIAVRERVSDSRLRVAVVGELKQGKSQLVNSLINAGACTVGDDEATAVPTQVHYAEQAAAFLALSDTSGNVSRQPVPLDEIHAITPLTPFAAGQSVLRLEIGIPSPVLREGLMLIDTPGVGGHGNPRLASTLSLLQTSDAVFFVTDASRELTVPEVDFLRQAAGVCPAAACVVTKTDLYPHWREIAAANERHLAEARIEIPVLAVSALLRGYALQRRDESLNQESGFLELFRFLRDDVAETVSGTLRRLAATDVTAATEHLIISMRAELASLRDPARHAERLADFEKARTRVEELHKRSALWQQTLNDGVMDLVADIEHDLRDRLRHVQRAAEETVDTTDPGPAWEELGGWLEDQAAKAVGDNFVWAHERSLWLAEQVGEHFALDHAVDIPDIELDDVEGVLEPVADLGEIESGKLSVTDKVMVGMRGSYGGILMVGLATTLVGMALINPLSIGAGVIFGARAYKEDMANRLQKRRADAKMAIRQYTDDVAFQTGKESRDRLRWVQRQLRDHFTDIAGQTLRSLNDSVRTAQEAVNLSKRDREVRIAQLESSLAELTELKAAAQRMLGK